MARIEVYSKEWCPYCIRAKALLRSKNLEYLDHDVNSDAEREQEMRMRSQRHTVPQIFIDGKSVGGYADLVQLNATGELDRFFNIGSSTDLAIVRDVATIDADCSFHAPGTG